MKEMTQNEYKEYKLIIAKAINDYRSKYNMLNTNLLFEESNYVLAICLKNFKEEKEVKFTTYLYNCLFLQFHKVVMKDKKSKYQHFETHYISKYNKEDKSVNLEEYFELNTIKTNTEKEIIDEDNINYLINIIYKIIKDDLFYKERLYLLKFKESLQSETAIKSNDKLFLKIRNILKNKYNITKNEII